MSTAQVTILVIVIVAVVLLVAVAVVFNRRRALRQRFGPEYDRVVESADDRRAAERELRERERRHAELELRAARPRRARSGTTHSWEEIQVRFVDAPEQAVGQADELVTRLIAERGYPTGDYDDQLSHLSVEHSRTLDHYRQAHDINERNARGEATTEQLRQAFVHYRALFADLLGTEPDRLAGSTPNSDATPDRERQS
jgi:hypothetical protein